MHELHDGVEDGERRTAPVRFIHLEALDHLREFLVHSFARYANGDFVGVGR